MENVGGLQCRAFTTPTTPPSELSVNLTIYRFSPYFIVIYRMLQISSGFMSMNYDRIF